jgi:hypothetical protein
MGGHGVPGGGRPYRHRHQCEVCSTVVLLAYRYLLLGEECGVVDMTGREVVRHPIW